MIIATRIRISTMALLSVYSAVTEQAGHTSAWPSLLSKAATRCSLGVLTACGVLPLVRARTAQPPVCPSGGSKHERP